MKGSGGSGSWSVADSAGENIPVEFRENPRAKRYILKIIPGGGAVVTVPRGGSLRDARVFATRHHQWIFEQHRQQHGVSSGWEAGTVLWYRGEKHSVRVHHAGDRMLVTLGSLTAIAGIGGAGAGIRQVLTAAMRKEAKKSLPVKAITLARIHGFHPKRVTIRNQSTRWGSCSSQGAISLNWRLIQMPEDVSSYVIIHELCHLEQMDHSPAYWSRVADLCPDYESAEAWIRDHGATLLT